MGDVNGRDSKFGEEFLQEHAHVFAGGLVEGRKGLIEQQQAGLDRQDTGEGDALTFAAAE